MKIWIVVALLVVLAGNGSAGVVASTLWLECRGEPEEGRMEVASVIWNRSKIRHLTVDQVCLQPKQFSCWNDQKPKDVEIEPVTVGEMKIWLWCKTVEHQMLSGTFVPQSNRTDYHATRVHPYWSDGMKNKKVIGRHLFGISK